jgi:hypothetical protein
MKAALMKTFFACAALLVAVSFVGLALMAGTRAVNAAGGARSSALLIALALSSTLLSAARSARLRLSMPRLHPLAGRRTALKQLGY